MIIVRCCFKYNYSYFVVQFLPLPVYFSFNILAFLRFTFLQCESHYKLSRIHSS